MNSRRKIIAFVCAGIALATAPAQATKYAEVPTGKVFVPTKLFARKHIELDRVVLNANPRLYVYPDFDASTDLTLVVGLPGWGGRSEKFIWTLINGLKLGVPTKSLVVASIQDLKTGGPRYQGQGDRAHANVWGMYDETIKAMRHFIVRLNFQFGKLKVYIMGFSSGGVIAPRLAIRLARWAGKERYSIDGSIALGTGSGVTARDVMAHNQRVLFIVVPEISRKDPKPMRDDQWNRMTAEKSFDRLIKQGASVHLRYIFSAKRHIDWHWGLLSQCRFFRYSRIDPGRGYWPNYQMPNPETYAAIVPFVLGKEPPVTLDGWKPSKCPY